MLCLILAKRGSTISAAGPADSAFKILFTVLYVSCGGFCCLTGSNKPVAKEGLATPKLAIAGIPYLSISALYAPTFAIAPGSVANTSAN